MKAAKLVRVKNPKHVFWDGLPGVQKNLGEMPHTAELCDGELISSFPAGAWRNPDGRSELVSKRGGPWGFWSGQFWQAHNLRADVWWKRTEYDRGAQTEGSQRLLEDEERKCQELQFELDALRQVNADIMMQLQDVKGLYDVARSQVRPRVANHGRQLHTGMLCVCYPVQPCSEHKMLARAAARRTKGARANQFQAGDSSSSSSSGA